MYYVAPKSADQLLLTANEMGLYQQLIAQLNKDFALANQMLDLPDKATPLELKQQVEDALYHLIQHHFSDYLNLLYIIDVSEEETKALDGSDLLLLAEQAAFLVVKRAWQKVWFRKFY